jgi:exonuclease VII small subunit
MVYPPYAMTDDLTPLEISVRFYEGEVKNAREAVDRAQTRLAGAERDYQIAMSFLELERRRLSTSGPTPFSEMTLRDACVSIVRQKGKATTKEIIEALEKGGLKLETEFPGRAIHTALMRAKEVRKVGPGTYESEQGRLI